MICGSVYCKDDHPAGVSPKPCKNTNAAADVWLVALAAAADMDDMAAVATNLKDMQNETKKTGKRRVVVVLQKRRGLREDLAERK